MTDPLWLTTDSKVDEVKSSAVARNKPAESQICKVLGSASVLILTSGLWPALKEAGLSFFLVF